MNFGILTEPSEVEPYIEQIQGLADSNKKALGFLPKSIFKDQTKKGRVWIAKCEESDNCLGYLMFGGRFPTLKVFQLIVAKKYRKQKIGSNLISNLKSMQKTEDI